LNKGKGEGLFHLNSTSARTGSIFRGSEQNCAAMKKSAKEKIPDYKPEYKSFQSWHRRMLELLGIQPSEEMDDLPILKLVAPVWCSGEVCICLSLS